MRMFLRWSTGLGLVVLLSQPSCRTVEREALAGEPGAADGSRETCELGSLRQVSGCGGAEALCHICARIEDERGVCVRPCRLDDAAGCPGGQTCRPIGELRDAGGYARIGDCPVGYCR